MRSLRSLHEQRASSPQKFEYLLQNDFCNTIPPIADMAARDWYVREVPIPEVARLLDHFVGAGEKRRWNVKTERSSCPKIDR